MTHPSTFYILINRTGFIIKSDILVIMTIRMAWSGTQMMFIIPQLLPVF